MKASHNKGVFSAHTLVAFIFLLFLPFVSFVCLFVFLVDSLYVSSYEVATMVCHRFFF